MSRFPAYRSSYNSRHGLPGPPDIDSSTHSHASNATCNSTGHNLMDISMRSHHNFLGERDKDLDMESDHWPAPMGLMNEEEAGDNADISDAYANNDHTCYDCWDHSSSADSSGCLTQLASLLCCLYSESDADQVVHGRRPVLPCGSRLHSCSRLMSSHMAGDLYDMLPDTAKIAPPTLLFATYRDGWSMESLLAKTRDKDAIVLLVKAARSEVVLGAFSTAKLSPPSTRVRGNGECFVFRLSTPSAAYRWTYVPSMKKASQNQFVVSCRDYIAFGASEDGGNNAIRLDNDLRFCDSGASDTYQNHPLVPEEWCGESEEGGALSSAPFEVMDIEVLHVGSGRRRG